MQRNEAKALRALVLAALSTGAVYAQSSTQGAIGGTVYDATGAVVPGAQVTIHRTATNADVHVTADDSGFFKAPLLEPGSYTVTIEAPGFSGYRANDVVVQVGQLTNLSGHLAAAGAAEQVSVSADEPVMNTEGPDYQANINEKALENIPVNNRRWSSLALLTPGITVDSSGFGLVSVRGISTILNNVEIDGADDNQAYFSEERGRTREAYSTSGSAVREFQVNSGVYSAEFGRAAGGVINSVTKSGTNQIHGEAYFWDRESKWNAYQDQTTLPVTNPTTGVTTTIPYKPEDVRKIYGLTVGGPLIKDKLFGIYTFDQHARIFPLAGVPTNPALFDALPDAALPSNASCNLATGLFTGTVSNTLDAQACLLAARLGLGSYAAGASNYQSGITALNTDIGTIPRTGYQEINTPKVDWQINDREHVSFLYHRLRWDSPGGVQTNASGAYAYDSAGNDFVKLDYGVAKLTSLVTKTISNELLYQYGRELNDETQQPLSAYSLANLASGPNAALGTGSNVTYVNLDEGSEGFYLGSPYYSYRPAYPDERKWQVGDTMYISRGNQSIKVGADIVHNYDLSNQAQYYEGDYTYSTNIGNYLADLGAKNLGLTHGVCDVNVSVSITKAGSSGVGDYPCYSSYLQEYGPQVFAFSTLDYGLFVQDNWKITPRLSLELGVRYDYEKEPSAVASLTAPTGSFVPFNGINNNPSDKNNYGPRIGFSYDAYGDGKTIVRGGYGIYYGRVTNGNIGTVISTTGSPLAQTSTTLNAKSATANGAFVPGVEPLFPDTLTAAQETSGAKPSAYFRASNLQNPQVQEFDLQVQQNLGRGTIFQVSYLGALGRELPNFLDVNLNPTTTNVNITVVDPTGKSPLPNGTVVSVPTFTSYGNTALLGPSATKFQAVTEYLSNINSSYNALAFEIQNRSLKSLQFDASYTWAHALDFYQNANTAGATNAWYNPYSDQRANYGNSSFDIPNRFVGYALYNFPGLSGGSGLKYLTNDWSLDNTFQFQTGLPYSASVSGSNSSSAVLGDWNGNGSVSYVPQLGHNNYFFHRDLIDDVRVEKQFPIKERYRLQIFLQAFNVANHQNETSANSTIFKLTGTGATTGTATYQSNFGTVSKTNNSGFSYTPRELELAARFSF